MNRFDRVTATLLLLHTRRVVRARDLAERFGVSERTVYRDLRTLEAAGLPVVGTPGAGYALVAGYRLAPVAFSRDEAAALLVAERLAARLTDRETARHAASAMDKVCAVLRPAEQAHVEALLSRFDVRGARIDGPAAGTDGVYVGLLRALAEGRVVRLHYRTAGGNRCTRDVEPAGLTFGVRWALVAYCRERAAFRTFRLDRIEALDVLDEPAPPRDMSAFATGQNLRRRTLRAAHVTFAVGAQPDRDAARAYGWAADEPLPDGRLRMTFLPTSFDYLAAWVLPQADAVTDAAPADFADALRALAGAAARQFGASPP